jgi:ATP-binding cassette subfamily F protein 3
LAKTIASKANFLMLDEPTNHLDIHSVDLLVESLNKYEGSLILVSHDRYFISRLANKIWEIEDHKIREFKGSYAEWEDWKERRTKAEAESKKNEKVVLKNEKSEVKPEKVIQKTVPTNDHKKDLQKIKTQFKQLEEKIVLLNKNKSDLENSLALPDIYNNKNKFIQAETDYKKAAAALDEANKSYEILFEKIIEMD